MSQLGYITDAEKQRRLRKIKSDSLKGKNVGINRDTIIQISLVRMPRPTGKIYRDQVPSVNIGNNKGPVLTKKIK